MLRKKLRDVSKANPDIEMWTISIVNHLYWVGATSDDDPDVNEAKWLSFLNHVINKHTGHSIHYPECHHPIPGPPIKGGWLKPGTFYSYPSVICSYTDGCLCSLSVYFALHLVFIFRWCHIQGIGEYYC